MIAIMKKTYNQPVVEMALMMPHSYVMLKVSEGGTDDGEAHMPGRKGEIIP